MPQEIPARWLDPAPDMGGEGVVYPDEQGNRPDSVSHPATGIVGLRRSGQHRPQHRVYRRRK
jgi:hypothetical protein